MWKMFPFFLILMHAPILFHSARVPTRISSLAKTGAMVTETPILPRTNEVLECQIQRWYPRFKNVTVKTEILDLPEGFRSYLLSDGVFLPKNSQVVRDDLWDRLVRVNVFEQMQLVHCVPHGYSPCRCSSLHSAMAVGSGKPSTTTISQSKNLIAMKRTR